MSKFNVVEFITTTAKCTTPLCTLTLTVYYTTTPLCALCVVCHDLGFPGSLPTFEMHIRHLDQTLKIMFQKYLSETGNHRTIISMGKSRLINVSSKFILKGSHNQSTFSRTETIQKNRYVFVKFILR